MKQQIVGIHACTGVRVILNGTSVSYQTGEKTFRVVKCSDEKSAHKLFATLTQKNRGRIPDRDRAVAYASY